MSAMADAKANMMITVSSVVFSITLSRMDASDLRWPLLTLCGFSLGSLIAAVLTVMPANTRSSSAPAPGSPLFNALFFGHFQQLDEETFMAEVARSSRTDDGLYRALLRDIYTHGKLLGARKYRRLRVSYGCFLTGVLVAGLELAFVVWRGVS